MTSLTAPSTCGARSEIRRRHFVAVATATYEEYHDLPVEAEVKQLQDWLTDRSRLGARSFALGQPTLPLNPSEDDIRAMFRKPDRPWNERDAAVVFITGHGEVVNGSHWLVLSDSESANLPGTAIRTGDLISWLHHHGGAQHLLLIIDACFAGAVATDTIRFDRDLPPGWLILPSAARDGKATAGALTNAIASAVAELRDPTGAKHGTHRCHFLVSEFVDTVRAHLERSYPGQQLVPIYRGQMGAEHLCLPNPHYVEPDTVATQPQRHDLALPRTDLTTHWAPRHAGSAATDRWLFTGRAELVRELIAQTCPDPAAPSSVLLVSGCAGSGKSAVLARLVTLADPDFVAAWADRVAEIPDDLRPRLGAVDVAVLATGKYPHEVLSQIAEALEDAPDARSSTSAADLNTRVEACLARLDSRAAAGNSTVLVVDALDEAENPAGLANALARLTGGQGVKLIVGVRSPSGPGQSPASSAGSGGSLADRLERLTTSARIRVDHAPWWNQDDLREYTASYLRHTPQSPYNQADLHNLAGRLADAIASRVGRSFLIGRLAANALTQRDNTVDPSDPTWLSTLDDDVVTAFRNDLQRVHPDPEDRLAAVELLRAVAFAYGRGLPWGEIWPAVANAVADRNFKYGDRDIAALLGSPLSAYLTTDVEDDTTVYKLFHDALRNTLRDRWHDLLEPSC